MSSGQGQALLSVLLATIVIVSIRLVTRLFSRRGPGGIGPECATLITLSEDLQRRIGAGGTAMLVGGWDGRAYRSARSRLVGLEPPAPVKAALKDLDEARQELTTTWRFSMVAPTTPTTAGLDAAMREHATAIEHFATASSVLVRLSWQHEHAA